MSGVRVSQPVRKQRNEFKSSSLNFKDNKMINYIKESYNELKNHVTWTSWSEAQRLTVVVAVFSVLLALAVWGVDTVFSGVVGKYFDWIKS